MVRDHCHNPRNARVIEDAGGVGEVGNPQCGDMVTFLVDPRPVLQNLALVA